LVLRKKLAATAVFALVIWAVCCSGFRIGISAQSSGSTTVDSPEISLIHYGDLIDVDVVGSLEYDWRGTVDPEGFLDGFKPGNETIYGLCRSESAVAEDITRQYSRILRDPKVVVKIIDRSGRALALLVGAVRSQQRFRLTRPARLNELLSASGGITDLANGMVTIFRPPELNCINNSSDAKPVVLKISLSDLLAGKESANPVILSGDIITIAEAAPIYIIGGVNAPKQIAAKQEITLSRAVAAAGGLSKEADQRDVVIYRRAEKGTRTISADLRAISSGKKDDPLLMPNDVVDVAQKGRQRPKLPPVIDSSRSSRDIYKSPVTIIE